MAVVVVESPAKAKTIERYLGPGFTVLASYGHVRDLPPKDGSVDTDNEFEMKWEVASTSQKHIRAIVDAMKADTSDTLILATDPDREGEAISWHLEEALRKRRVIKKSTKVERVVFNAITKNAVTTAMKNPRQVDMELVEAYLARRALDYLVGFKLSPVLWRKLPGAKSAGRVQSVCLRLIVEREMEIEAFNNKEYWTVKAALQTPTGKVYEARLTVLGGKKLDKFDMPSVDTAEIAVQAITSRDLTVQKVEAKPGTRNPSAPFMTSTLQQEASRKFGFGARQTMSTAQRLYEAGYITYMRTDGIDMAPEAVTAARETIKDKYGDAYVPAKPRIYKNKAKNAQEAHECIRPTEMSQDAGKLARLEADQRKLYDLIWKRTISSQMAAARLERTSIDVGSADGDVVLRATGQVVQFDGFLRVYEEGRDDVANKAEEARLPVITEGDAAKPAVSALVAEYDKFVGSTDDVIDDSSAVQGVRRDAKAILSANAATMAQQHFTQPPPRYTEATLVKRMEELGIGRPSTYASVVTTIQDRGYVRKDKNRMIPEDKGRLVTAFLESYFRKIVGYNFTAALEDDLDKVSAGKEDWKALLGRFWEEFSASIAETSELRITDVLEKINEVLEPHLFPVTEDNPTPRICKNCGKGTLSLRTARSGGAFIGCSNYPECRYTRPLAGEVEGGDMAGLDGKVLGVNEEGVAVTLRAGRFGPYVQLGEPTEEMPKPKRASIPKGMEPAAVELAKALELLSLPRTIGDHPEGGVITAAIGPYGPYILHTKPAEEKGKKPSKVYVNIPEVSEVFTIGMNHAVELIASKPAGRGRGQAAEPIKELGEHPDGGEMNVMKGRYGPYIKWEKVNATLPKDTEPQDVTVEMAIELVNAKAATKGKRKAPVKKKAPVKRKPAAKKKAPAKRKPAAKKKPVAKK